MVITLVITLLSAHYKWGFESAFILAVGLFTILTMFAFITSDSFMKKLLLFGIVAGITQLIADKWLVEDIDGYADQLSEPKEKKCKDKNVKKLFLDIASEPMDKQKVSLERTMEDWKGELEQIDDILIKGVKI